MISNIAILGLLCIAIGGIAFIYYTVIRYSKSVKSRFDSLVKVVDSLNDANNTNRLACEDKSSLLENAIKRIEADIETLKKGDFIKDNEWLYWKLEKAEKALSDTKSINERIDSIVATNKPKRCKDKDGD